MGRSTAVILFIAAVAAVALYCAQLRTVARGDVLAAELVEANPLLERLACDDRVPIGVSGARFDCRAIFKNGDEASYTFELDRDGHIRVAEEGPTQSRPRIKKTSDPWGD